MGVSSERVRFNTRPPAMDTRYCCYPGEPCGGLIRDLLQRRRQVDPGSGPLRGLSGMTRGLSYFVFASFSSVFSNLAKPAVMQAMMAWASALGPMSISAAWPL